MTVRMSESGRSHRHIYCQHNDHFTLVSVTEETTLCGDCCKWEDISWSVVVCSPDSGQDKTKTRPRLGVVPVFITADGFFNWCQFSEILLHASNASDVS